MPTLKYWDNGVWVYGTTSPATGSAVPVAGGTITGPLPLYVDAGGAPYDIIAKGGITASKMTTTRTGASNMGFALSAGKKVAFGDAEVRNIATSTQASGAVSRNGIDARLSTWETLPITLLSPWTNTASYQPVYARRNGEGLVVIGGIATTTMSIVGTPGPPFFNLPSGWRPLYRYIFPSFCSVSTQTFCNVSASPASVYYSGGPNLPAGANVALDNISFYLV